MKDLIGWIAALISIIGFGSFGAPIKSKNVTQLNVDPLVFQSYKTFMCFTTSWLVLLAGVEFTYTPWGIVSGLFWVPGGVATIFAIKVAGLAVAIGVGSSFIVLVSFIWGIFVFRETVHSLVGACIAIFLMMGGICGMAYFSSPRESGNEHPTNTAAPVNNEDNVANIDILDEPSTSIIQEIDQRVETSTGEEIEQGVAERFLDESTTENRNIKNETHITIYNFQFARRTLGIAAAVFNGTWGGSIMVPMHFSKGNTSGVGYTISFAIGASIITSLLWFLLFLHRLRRNRWSFWAAYHTLPSFHVRKMWKEGCLSGLLWSIGNFCSMISVQYLGEGVGYSVVQAAMLVSGLWGIFYFGEIMESITIAKWFVSAGLTVIGILLLSYEHQKALN